MKKLSLYILTFALMFALAACNRKDDDTPGEDIFGEMVRNGVVVATVDGLEITAGNISVMLPSAYMLEIEGLSFTDEEWVDMLEGAVEFTAVYRLIADYAARHGIEITDEDRAEVEDFITSIMLEYETDEEFYQALNDYGFYSMDNLRAFYYVDILNEHVVTTIMESPELFAEFESSMAEELLVKHILIMVSDFDSEEEAMVFARGIRERAVAGEDFNALIAEYGNDPGMETNPSGYFFQMGDFGNPAFENASYALAIGEISQPIIAPHGIHIILRLDPNAEEEILSMKRIIILMDDFEDEEEATAFAESLLERIAEGEEFDDIAWEWASQNDDLDAFIEYYGEEFVRMNYTEAYTFVAGSQGAEVEQAARELEIGELSGLVIVNNQINIILRAEPNMDNIYRPGGMSSPEERLEQRMAEAIIETFRGRVESADVVFFPELYEIAAN